ncbi:MAG TPA: flagellar biosynthetic protein FliQ [bacterium]|nr:flagellar biosynthetic protein FliQ [Candidatus Omnitrophota bacterium]HOJ59812.1 flagellar biosynthetic protein FliQ [bacterium]HOL93494.1 flagellar biosynthetic protein FliQ [bacterium]HPP00895.1 flagellar biosynthetic protein FliQ [bacterium]HXK92547.1 flagellar biosynthetic protein FliQ [bacterium]
MSDLFIIQLGQDMMFNALLISLPILGVGLAVGLLISMFQTATQINEQTLTIVPKLLVVGMTILFLTPWLIERMVDITMRMMNLIPEVARNF